MPRISPRVGAFLLALLLVVHGSLYVRALGGDAVDDAYISFRYAQNAILGHGLVFNPGERVEGFTNFLWTGLMIPVAGAGVDVGRVSMVLGLLFALGLLWLAFHLASALGLPPAAGWLAALLLAVDGSVAIWAVSGLETALFAFLVGAGTLFYLREQRLRLLVPASAVFFALAAMTRPEAAAVFALTALHQAVGRLAGERRLFTKTDFARGLTFTALFVPYWLLRWRYYHSFFPNSFYAKVAPGGPAAQLARGWEYTTRFVDVHLGWAILLPALAALALAVAQYLREHRRRPDGGTPRVVPAAPALFGGTYLALLILAYGAYIIYVGGDWSVGRFFVPILAPAYVLISAGFLGAYSLLRFRYRRIAGLAAIAFVLVGLALSSSWNGEYGIFVKGFDAARATQARETMGRWLKANAAAGTWIAVDAAGQVPYFSGLPAIDMFGINDLHIGRLNVPTLGSGTPGHEKFDLAYILQRAPRYVIIYGNLFDSVTEYRRAAVQWTSDPELEMFLTIYERN
ncbi:MAG: hypothetical protein ACM3JD_11065 [Rudaea sp.]